MHHTFKYGTKLDDAHPIECYLRKYKDDYPNGNYDFIMVDDLEILIKDFIRRESEALPDFYGKSGYEWFYMLVSLASEIPFDSVDCPEWEENNNEWERNVESYRAKFFPLEKSFGVIGDVNNDFPWGY